jgi:7,8-dihydroneopterin aldolase/epimerase/oxygenase
MDMAQIEIDNIMVQTVIGVHPWERQIKQKLLFDLAFEIDITKAAETDDVADTVDYAALTESLTHFVENSDYQLLESLASASLAHLKQTFDLNYCRLAVTKSRAINNAKGVRLVVESETV